MSKYEVYGDDYFRIRRYFDKLNEDKSHFVNSNDICTPIGCVKEMVDKIPCDFWQKEDIKVLDCCCGNGNFHAYIGTKTKLDNLYFNEINEKRIENLKDYFGDNINLTTKDFLTFKDIAEYDMVVANPPYAKFTEGKRTSKNHNMSRDFIEKALKVLKPNGYLLFIVPNNWMSFADRNTLPMILSEYQFIYLDIHGAKKYFPKVGSSFTWFILQKTPNKNPFTVCNNYYKKDKQTVTLDKGSKYIPLYYSEIVRSIFNKTINNESIEKYPIETSSNLHKFTKKDLIVDTPDPEHLYKLWHTPSQVVYSSVPHKYQDGYKVFISLTNQFDTFVDNCGMTQSIAFIRCKSKEEAEKIKADLQAPIYKFLNNLTRYGNFNNERILERLPVLGTFELTEEENQFVKEFNEIYYSSSKNDKSKKKKKSRNIVPLRSVTDLDNEVSFDEFDYKQFFNLLCKLRPNIDEEKLDIIPIDEDKMKTAGFIYVMVIKGKIFKIGQSTKDVIQRVGSYNTGKLEYRSKGTNSTTNFFVLHSLLNIGEEVEMYAYFPPLAKYNLFYEDIESSEAPSKYAERVIINDFIKLYERKPIGCTQE